MLCPPVALGSPFLLFFERSFHSEYVGHPFGAPACCETDVVASLDTLPSCNTKVGEKGGGAMLTRDKLWSWPGHSGKSICESTSLLLLHMKAAGHSSGGKLPQNSYICCRKNGELRLGRNCFLTTVPLKSGQHALLVKQGATVYSHNLGPNLLLALVSGCTALPRRHTWCGWLEGKSKQTGRNKGLVITAACGFSHEAWA